MHLATPVRVAIVLACFAATLPLAPAAHAQQGASIEEATAAQKKTAQKAFEKGMAAQKKGQHEEALAAFRESYGAVASPNSHLMVARALAELGRLDEAYVEYDATVTEAQAAAQTDKKYEQTAQAAEKERGDVRAKIALLTVEVSGAGEGARVSVRGKELEQSQWGKPIPVMPGTIPVELTLADGKTTSQDVSAEAGGSPTVTLSPPAPPPPPTTGQGEGSAQAELDTEKTDLRTWAYVAGGVGIAGLVTFGVFGIMNNSKHSELEDNCRNGVCSKDLEDTRDTGQTYQTIANIGLAVGVIGLGTGTVLYFLSGNQEKTADRRSERRRAASAPRVDVNVGPRWVGVTGAF